MFKKHKPGSSAVVSFSSFFFLRITFQTIVICYTFSQYDPTSRGHGSHCHSACSHTLHNLSFTFSTLMFWLAAACFAYEGSSGLRNQEALGHNVKKNINAAVRGTLKLNRF